VGSRCRPQVCHGTRRQDAWDEGGAAAGRQQERLPFGELAKVLDGQDPLAADGEVLTVAPLAVVDGANGDVVLTDEAGNLVEEPVVVKTGTDELDRRRCPERVHPRVAPDPGPLSVALKDGDGDDPP
jgi:hypothetical protein